MIFNVTHPSNKVKTGYEIAGTILADANFHDRILAVPKFTYTKRTPQEVQAILFSNVQDILVHGGKKVEVGAGWNDSKNVIAWTNPSDGKLFVFVNNNGLSLRSEVTLLGNGIHEFGHEPLGFTHGTNFPPGSWRGRLLGDKEDKTKSVPHLLASMAIEYAKERRYV